MNINDRRFNLFLFDSKVLTPVGVDLNSNLSSLVKVNVVIVSSTTFVRVTFRGLLTKDPVPIRLFRFLSGKLLLHELFVFFST